MPTKILGREPVAIIGFLEALIAFALTIHVGWWGWDAQTDAIIMAFVLALGGIYGAWATEETLLGAVVTALKAGFALALAFNFPLNSVQQAGLISLVTVGLALFYRDRTTPNGTPVDSRAMVLTTGSAATLLGTLRVQGARSDGDRMSPPMRPAPFDDSNPPDVTGVCDTAEKRTTRKKATKKAVPPTE